MTSTPSAEPAQLRTFSAVADDALGTHDMTSLLAALRAREVSPDEVRTAALDRSQRADAALNAVVCWLPPDRCGPAESGPFAGVPSFLKDNEDVVGLPTRHGSGAVPAHPLPVSSLFADQFAGLGFGVLGKTSLPEFGLTATTEPRAFGPTRNPWHLDHSTGGSSGGSAALVAAGAVPVANANDGGGSIRIPAACCGLFGLKPTRGRLVTPERVRGLPIELATEGVLTRSVRDSALFLAEAEKLGGDPRYPLAPVGHVVGAGPRRLRIGVFDDGLAGGVSPEVAEAVRRAAAALAGAGHHIEVIGFPFSLRFGKDFLRYWAMLAWLLRLGGPRLYGPDWDGARLEPFTHGLADFFRTVAARSPASVIRLRRFGTEYARAFEGFDVLLSPVTATTAPELGYLDGEDFDVHIRRLLHFAGFTAMANIAGAPAMSVPMGVDSRGLPLSAHLGALPGEEGMLLELAYELEGLLPWQQFAPAGAPSGQPTSVAP